MHNQLEYQTMMTNERPKPNIQMIFTTFITIFLVNWCLRRDRRSFFFSVCVRFTCDRTFLALTHLVGSVGTDLNGRADG